MDFNPLTAEQRRSFDDDGLLAPPNAMSAETVTYFQAIAGPFTYFSLQLGDPVWRGKNVLDFGGSIGAILLERELERGKIMATEIKEAAA